jgi:hypothetical protein
MNGRQHTGANSIIEVSEDKKMLTFLGYCLTLTLTIIPVGKSYYHYYFTILSDGHPLRQGDNVYSRKYTK